MFQDRPGSLNSHALPFSVEPLTFAVATGPGSSLAQGAAWRCGSEVRLEAISPTCHQLQTNRDTIVGSVVMPCDQPRPCWKRGRLWRTTSSLGGLDPRSNAGQLGWAFHQHPGAENSCVKYKEGSIEGALRSQLEAFFT